MPPISDVARAKVRARVESTMDALVTILRGGRGSLDPSTLLVSGMAGATTVYDDPASSGKGGKAHLHVVTGQGSVATGAGNIDMRQVVVAIPWSAPAPRRDDVVWVRSPGQDTGLAGAALRVVEVSGGGLFGDARRASCTLWGTSPSWTGAGTGAIT